MSVTTAAFFLFPEENLQSEWLQVWDEVRNYFHTGLYILKKIGLHLFCGPSPTRYSMTRSTAPRSLGRIGLANGGPGGCRPVKTDHKHGNEHTHTNTHKTDRHILQHLLQDAFTGFTTYLHLVWGSRGSWVPTRGGQRQTEQISPVVLLELREGQVL